MNGYKTAYKLESWGGGGVIFLKCCTTLLPCLTKGKEERREGGQTVVDNEIMLMHMSIKHIHSLMPFKNTLR